MRTLDRVEIDLYREAAGTSHCGLDEGYAWWTGGGVPAKTPRVGYGYGLGVLGFGPMNRSRDSSSEADSSVRALFLCNYT